MVEWLPQKRIHISRIFLHQPKQGLTRLLPVLGWLGISYSNGSVIGNGAGIGSTVSSKRNQSSIRNTWQTLNRQLSHSPSYTGSEYSAQLEQQWAMANNVQSLCDYFCKLQHLLQTYAIHSNDIYNINQKEFALGYSVQAKVICHCSWRSRRVIQDGTWEQVIVIEWCSAGFVVLTSFVI